MVHCQASASKTLGLIPITGKKNPTMEHGRMDDRSTRYFTGLQLPCVFVSIFYVGVDGKGR